MKESLKEYLTELKERANFDEKLSQEEKDADKAKLKKFYDDAKFDPNAVEEDDEATAKPAEGDIPDEQKADEKKETKHGASKEEEDAAS